ncbi:MAG: sigma-54-dependent Fis family transcriptional regulator [bacterium]|nr:sigma-54-dependent Fis family transcriptional regulator [bacterium]
MPVPTTVRLLLVDDEVLSRRALARTLASLKIEITALADADEASAALEREDFEGLLIRQKTGGRDGLELIRRARELYPQITCILLADLDTPEASRDALEAGAFWVLPRPFEHGFAAVRDVVQRALASCAPGDGSAQVKRAGSRTIIGESAALQSVLSIAHKVASSAATVLVTGESGTGKELFARAIHDHSRRADRAFIPVNCGAIPEDLLESELFGHVRGAFTHAVEDRQGRFTLADGGTIFLDEIGDMSPSLQVKLLRVLEDGCFEPVGASRTQRVDVRVIAATNQKLEAAMQVGQFRRDLFYRLNVVPIELPPLRERREDVPTLVEHFMKRILERRGVQRHVSASALELLQRYDWPGNVRELENVLERVVLLSSGDCIRAEDLPPPIGDSRPQESENGTQLPGSGLAFSELVARYERDLLKRALDQTGWNKSRAAVLLGLNRTTLLEMIKRRDVTPDTTQDRAVDSLV